MQRVLGYLVECLLTVMFLLLVSAIDLSAATFTVSNTSNTGAGSLRQAITDSNTAAGSDTIVFDSSFNSPQTITLASVITINPGTGDSLTITGPGANLLTISGNNAVRIFTISTGDTTSISGITFTQAVTGAISNGGSLTVTDSIFNANTNSGGGAIINSGVSLVVTGCAFTNNTNTAPGVNGAGGAAIYNTVSATITNSTFSNNVTTSGAGGGAIDNRGTMIINGSTFTGNMTTSTGQNSRGGAINLQSAGQLTINNSILDGNSSTKEGGAIYYQPNSSTGPPFLNINNSTISNNTANSDGDTTGNGGGLYLEGTGSVTITGSTINGNTSKTGSTSTGNGGGINVSMPMTIINSTISGNTAERNGGGIYASGVSTSIVNITNATIAGNTATINAGGIQRASTTNPVNFRNSIFADNIASGGTSPDVLGAVNSNGFNLIENTTGATFTGDTSTNITGQDPNLGPLQNNGGATFTHALLQGSPAIDKGESSGASSDQRGQTRPVDKPSVPNAAGGDGADIGAFEDQPIVMLSAAAYSVNEPDLTATITVLRSGGTNGVDTVQYSTNSLSATGGASCTDGVDFINASGTLTFDDGAATQTFTVTICNDSLVEDNETIGLDLLNPSGKTLGTPSSAVLTIISEDVYVPQKPFADFDGDGKTDLAVFRPNADPAVFDFAIRRSFDNALIGYSWGLPGDKLAPGDYDGDGKTDVAVYREGAQNTFYIIRSSDGTVIQDNFGLSGDILTVGDWDGDGKDDESVYREGAQSYFFYRASANNPNRDITYLPWGTTGDKPVRGDFDGDGKTDAAVFRASNNTWYIRNSSNGQARFENWGIASDKFVPADYDGDGKTDLAVYRNGVWYIKQSIANQARYETFGIASDTPVPADYDGDGKADIAVYRNGAWYLMQSTSGFAGRTFGTGSDTPVPSAYIIP